MSVGLTLFNTLCDTSNAIIALREDSCVPGSDLWTALTQLAGTLDALIDVVVMELPIEGMEEDTR